MKRVIKIPANNQEFDSLLKVSGMAFGNAIMIKTGEKPGIMQYYIQDVFHSSLKRGIVDLPIITQHGFCIDYELHSGIVSDNIVFRNYQYCADLSAALKMPVKPHIISLDENRTPIPDIEIFPGFKFPVNVTFFTDFDGEKILNNIMNKIENNETLDEMDAYDLGLMPFYKNTKSRKEVLVDMISFVNEIEISEEFKYIIKLIQIFSTTALFENEESKKLLEVIKMKNTYIQEYEKNLIMEGRREVALKMKADGFSSDFIFKYFGIRL